MAKGFWWFNANIERKWNWDWDILESTGEEEWVGPFSHLSEKYKNKEVKVGDVVIGYSSSPGKKYVQVLAHISRRASHEGAVTITVKFDRRIGNPIAWNEMKENLILRESQPMKMRNRGSIFKITPEEWQELKKLMVEKNPNLEIGLNCS